MRAITNETYFTDIGMIDGVSDVRVRICAHYSVMQRRWFQTVLYWPKYTTISISAATVVNFCDNEVLIVCKRDERTVFTCAYDIQSLVKDSGCLICDFSYNRNESDGDYFEEWKYCIMNFWQEFKKAINSDELKSGTAISLRFTKLKK